MGTISLSDDGKQALISVAPDVSNSTQIHVESWGLIGSSISNRLFNFGTWRTTH